MVLPTSLPTSILVIADSNFINLCQDPEQYLDKLKTVVGSRKEEGVVLYTVPGKYGIHNLDKNVAELPNVQDKNKTVFMQTLENSNLMFDELLIVSIAEEDNYINGAKEVMTSLNKSFTHYRYQRKS